MPSVFSVVNPLLAFGFANLIALGWLAAAAAPILIHLWMRQTRRETPWAAIRFLQAALERQARKLRLQHWLLLAVRTLILVCVALAAAKPFFDSGPLTGGVRTHWVLAIDASLSMQYQEAQGTRLDAAKQQAAQLVRAARSGDKFSLCVLSTEASLPLGQPTSDATTMLDAIDRIEPTEGVTDLTRAVALIGNVLQAEKASPASAARSEVVFLSDLGANSWSEIVADSSKSSAGSLSKLSELASLSVLDVASSDAGNLAVTGVAISDPLPTTRAPVEIRGELRRYGADIESEQSVELLVDGLVVDQRSVSVGEGRPASIDFLHSFRQPGPHSVSLRVGEDRLAADNHAWLATTLSERIRVLCIEGSRGSARYVIDALNPSGDNSGPIEPIVASDADLSTIELNDFACVIFCDVAVIGETEGAILARYLEGGGGLVLFLGPRAESPSYNEFFQGNAFGDLSGSVRSSPVRLVAQSEGTTAARAGVAPLVLGEPTPAASYGVDPLEYAHPIVRPFKGRETAGLLTTPIARVRKLSLDGELQDKTRIALALEGGMPLLVTSEYGRGRLAVVTTAPTLNAIDAATGEPWTAMPAWPSFLPIVHGLVQYVGADKPSGAVVGEPLSGRISGRPGSLEELTMIRPDGDEEVIGFDRSGEWSYARTDKAGVYQLTGIEGGAVLGVAAVNPDPAESALTRVATDNLPNWISVRRASDLGAGILGDAVSRASAHRLLILAAIVLVLVESALACWFGKGSA